MEILSTILPYIVSIATFVAGLFTGRRKRRNDCLQELQTSIDLLTGKNTDLIKKIVDVNAEVIMLRNENAELKVGQERLLKENAQLREELKELNEKLSNVKTITRKA